MKNLYNDIVRAMEVHMFSDKELYGMTHNEKGMVNSTSELKRKEKSIRHHQNLHLLKGLRCSEKNGIPIIDPYQGAIDLKFTSFCNRRKVKGEEYAIHFFVDDYRFENHLDRRFEQTTSELVGFGAVFSPDFSIYSDMPEIFKKAMIFKRQLYGAYWQQCCGMKVIPTVGVPEAALLDYALEGIPENSVLAFCGTGHQKNKSALDLWRGSIYETVERKNPTVLIISGEKEKLPGIKTEIIFIPNHINILRKHNKS